MLISTEIGSIANFVGEEKAVELVGKSGFDAWDFSMFKMGVYDWGNKCIKNVDHPLSSNEYLAFARKLKRIGEDYGIHCNQSHAPFPVYCKEIRDRCKRAIECTAEAGGSICVIHPDNHSTPEENARMYFELLPFAKEYGVKIATENMWNWSDAKNCADHAACSTAESFLAHLNAVNDEYFVACLDIGHAEMMGKDTSASQMIEALGHHLQALHIHDNDKKYDSHNIPFSMQIDFGAVAASLKKIGYSGYLTLEADRYIANCGAKTADEVYKCVCELAESSRQIDKMIKEA